MLTHYDLFSGIGGFALAAKKCGFRTIYFCEKDIFCQKVLNKNFPLVPIIDDIKSFPARISRPPDLLTAGFPCQPFSQAGNKKGIYDDRYLWPHCLRIIIDACPKWIVLENVSGIIKMELENIVTDLEACNYEVGTFILPACAANAPHRRDRVWIIAYDNSIRSNERFRDREARYIQTHQNRHLAEIQQEWEQFIPHTWSAYRARDWLSYNARIMRRDDGLPSRMDKDRIKSLGNSIVPQIVYPVLKYISLIL